MKRKQLEKIMERNDFYESEIESAINFIEDMFLECAKETEKNEPYTTNSIQRMRDAAREVRDLEEAILEAMENDEEV